MTEESETKVLIVEDEAHIAAGLKLNLELEGYSVDVAKTGREAGEFLLNAQRYGVIILDVMLPIPMALPFVDVSVVLGFMFL